MSKNRRRNEQGLNPAKKQHRAVNGNRAVIKIGLIVGILLFALVGFGAMASWRQFGSGGSPPFKGGVDAVSADGVVLDSAQPLPTPQYAANAPVKEYIFAGGKLLAVSQPVQPVPADLAIWRPSGQWWVLGGPGSVQTVAGWGQNGDFPIPGDYDGDGNVDFATWRDANGNWFIRQSSLLGQAGELRQVQWGQSGDIPVPAFYRR